MFNLGEVKESNGNGGLYIYPGVKEVVIVGFSEGSSKGGTPFIAVELATKEAVEAKTENASKSFQFYVSEKARDISLQKIKHIMTKVTTEANLDKDVASISEFVQLLNTLGKGKSYRQKFVGEEYEYNGEIKEAARIGLAPFAEATQFGAEYEPVAEADSKLVYDKESKYDFKKLSKDNTPVDATTEVAAKVAW